LHKQQLAEVVVVQTPWQAVVEPQVVVVLLHKQAVQLQLDSTVAPEQQMQQAVVVVLE
jgi:hypothetical protein